MLMYKSKFKICVPVRCRDFYRLNYWDKKNLILVGLMVLVGVYHKIILFLCIVAKIMKKIRNDPNPRGLEAENKLKK